MKIQNTVCNPLQLKNFDSDTLLDTLQFISQKLSSELRWRNGIPEILEKLQKTTAATRIYLIEEHSAGWKILDTNSPQFPQSTFLYKGSSRFWMVTHFWLEIHTRNQPIYYGSRQDFPDLIEEFTELNILSLAIVPIKVKKVWWGMLGIENDYHKPIWSVSELNFLNIIGNLLGMSIQRHKLVKQKKSRQKQLEVQSFNLAIANYLSRSLPKPERIELSATCSHRFQCCKANAVEKSQNDLPYDSHFIRKVNHLLPGITYIYDLIERKYIYVSAQIKSILGYSTSDFQTPADSLFTKLIHPDDWETVEHHYKQFLELKGGAVVEIEYRLKHLQGQWLWFLAREVIFNEQTAGTPHQILGIIQDITTRKQAEQALQKSQMRLSEAQRIANLGNWEWDLITGEQQWSAEIIRICGLPSQEVPFTYETFEERLHHEDKEMVLHSLEQAIIHQQPYQIDFRVVRQDRSIRYVYAFGELIRSAGGKPLRLIGTAQDVTKGKQMVESLRSSEVRLKAIFDNAAVGIVLTDEHEQFLQVNAKWTQMTDYSEETLSTMRFSQLVHPEDVELNQESYAKLSRGEIVYLREEKRFIRRDNSTFWGDLSVTAIYAQNGQIQAYITIVVNITQHKQTEMALREAKEAAEVANHAKSAFLANISHELRTPLNAILGYTQILKRDSLLTQSQQDNVAVIYRSGEYLLTLINDVLDLSKIEAGRLELIPTDFYLEGFLKNINELFQMRAEQKGIAFNCQVLTYLPKIVHTDEIRLRQILINLLSNAIKFTKQGGVNFKISRHQQQIRFQVEDTGVGIAAADLSKIFLPFSQVGEYDYRSQGTGLGLAISKKLVELMGGNLYVESIVNQGTIFWTNLALPEVYQKLPPLFEPTTPTIIGYKMPAHLQKSQITILVVDDQSENRSVLVNLLANIGFEVVEASNGEECIEKVQQIHPEVIFMDLVMPVMDGFEATRQLKIKFPRAIVIAVSASAFECHQTQSLLAGCDDFIAKPVHTENLLECLQKHLHLQWQFSATLEEAPGTPKEQVGELLDWTETWSGKRPSPQQASILFKLAMTGNITGILDYLDLLEDTDQQLQPFARTIQRLAYDLKDEQIANLVKPLCQ
ncbi:MAG: hypothetical protein BWK78_04085 [Thiotrichaceae bacterium IS1]|nr:MAG: hypothetical protein BWK78_04085 [Thiotrichaceae bacterium IS1]